MTNNAVVASACLLAKDDVRNAFFSRVVSFDGDTFYATLIAWNYCHLKIVSHLIDAILY